MSGTLSRPAAIPEWSPARLYLVVSGVFLLVVAAAGFTIERSFPLSVSEFRAQESAHILGVLETNGWHNLAAVFSGSLALAFALRPEWARAGALFKGALYVAVTASLAIWGEETFRVATNLADQLVHASLALGGLITGVLTPRSGLDRPPG